MWLTAASGQGHNGTTQQGVKVKTNSTGDLLDLMDPGIVVENIIFTGWGNGSTYDRALDIDSANNDIRIRYNILDGNGNTSASGIRINGNNHNIFGNIIMNLPGGGATHAGLGIIPSTGKTGSKIINNTLFNTLYGIATSDTTGYALLKNNIVASATETYAGAYLAESGGNISSNASTTGSSTDMAYISASSLFVSTASGSINLHLRAGAAALDSGVAVASGTDYFTGDIDGETRGTDFGIDIGADEVTFSPQAWQRCRVVHGFSTSSTDWPASVTTTEVEIDPALSGTSTSFLFPVNSTLGTGNTTTEKYILSGYISSTTRLVLDRSSTSTSLLGYSYQALECSDNEFTVRRGSVTMNALVTSTDVSITPVESASASVVFVLSRPDGSFNYPMTTGLSTGRLVSSSTVRITRDNTASGTPATVRYEVIAFTTSSGVRVRSGEVDAQFDSSNTITQSIATVSTSASLAFCQFHSNSDVMAGVTLGCNLASSTGVSFMHGTTLAGLKNKIQYHVIQFPSGTVQVDRGNAFDDVEAADGDWYEHNFSLTGVLTRAKTLPFLTWYSTSTTGKAPPRERWIYGLTSTSTLKAAFRRPTTGAPADNYKYWQIARFPSPSVTQSAYRWFSNVDDAKVGPALGDLNSSTTIENTTPVRLRLLLRMSGKSMPTSSLSYFTLQYATSSGGVGTCDSGFSGENYVSISNTSGFYNNNSVQTDATAVASSGDPTDGGNTVHLQTYNEDNTFTNSVRLISTNENGLWDFSVSTTLLTAGTTYCFRAVYSNGDPLASYSYIPELTIYNPSVVSCSAAPSAVSLGTLTPSDISTASEVVTTTISCSNAGGCNLTVSSTALNGIAGLASSTLNDLIESQVYGEAATTTLAAGTDGYGLQVATTTAGSGSLPTLSERFKGMTGNNVGLVSSTEIVVASSSGSYTDRELSITFKAAASAMTKAGPGYENSLVLTCTANP